MKIIVNDANILIDLVELQILPYFFRLEFEFKTTRLILNELFEEQQEALVPYMKTGKLTLDDFSEDDIMEIAAIQAGKPNLSEQDCSAFFQAKKDNAALLTSDNSLRRFAKQRNIEVYGHLWIFDNFYEQKIISGTRAIELLNCLCTDVNPKLGLPGKECLKRIKIWKGNKH